jgi:hypothetical protein
MAKQKLRFKVQRLRWKRGRRGGGDHSAGGCAGVLWDTGAGAGTGNDQRLSISLVADADVAVAT